VDDAPAHRPEEPLSEEQERADVEEDGDEEGHEGRGGREADDDAELAAGLGELRPEEGDVGLDELPEGIARPPDGLADAWSIRFSARLLATWGSTW
jgi:hypothetical protein